MKELKIDKEFQDLIPALTKEEFETLEKMILSQGIKEPLEVWNGTIIDGHNRYAICKEHEIDPPVRDVDFENREEAMIYMIDNQRGRRNLSKADWLSIGFKRAELLKPKAKENQRGFKGNQYTSGTFQKSEKDQINTTAEAAKYAGVSTDTASKYKKVMESDNEEVKGKVKTGELSINRGYSEVRQPKQTEIEKGQEGEEQEEEVINEIVFEDEDTYLKTEGEKYAEKIIDQIKKEAMDLPSVNDIRTAISQIKEKLIEWNDQLTK